MGGDGASANSKIYKHPGERSLDVLAEFARGGWQNVSEYDPTAVPPPRKRPWLFRDGNVLYILGGMFMVSLSIALCICIFDGGTPKSSRRPARPKPSEKEN